MSAIKRWSENSICLNEVNVNESRSWIKIDKQMIVFLLFFFCFKKSWKLELIGCGVIRIGAWIEKTL